jgi:hypothetical protein
MLALVLNIQEFEEQGGALDRRLLQRSPSLQICLWCVCLQVISLSLVQIANCSETSTEPRSRQSVQTGQGIIMQPLCNNAQLDGSAALPIPFIVGVRSRVDTMHVPLQLNSFRELMSGPAAAAEQRPGPVTVYLRARGRQSAFVCAYVVVLTVMCVALGLYLLVAALDQGFVRPRPLNPSSINSCAGGCILSCWFGLCWLPRGLQLSSPSHHWKTLCSSRQQQQATAVSSGSEQQQQAAAAGHVNSLGQHFSSWHVQCTLLLNSLT